ncbi:hypothetical protein FB451DRAFT_1241994 [Mycena latifolia]|nr:hypothetical protein FB451DRAFT_1241994 [Mycena latifolia]
MKSPLHLRFNFPNMTTFNGLQDAYTCNALRVEAPDIGKEFTDSNFIGADPQGTLYYNDLSDLESAYTVNYKVETVVDPNDGNLLHIKFWHQNEDDCHAEFLAKDPKNTVGATGMDGYTYTGKWVDLNICCATAAIRKVGDMTTITVTAETVHHTATIEDSKKDLKGKSIDVKGNLYFKDSNTIKTGNFANWSKDRVVFYAQEWDATDFTAYVAFEYAPKDLGADVTNIFDVTWT